MNGIDRDTFKGYDIDSKLMTLFDLTNENYDCSCTTRDRLTGLEKKVYGISAVMGVLGGIGAVLVKTFFPK